MSKVFITHAAVGVDMGSSMRVRAYDKDLVECWIGAPGGEFEISFEVDAFRQLLELGGHALAEADALRAQEQAKADTKRSEAKEPVA
jgi:hypothetical protein